MAMTNFVKPPRPGANMKTSTEQIPMKLNRNFVLRTLYGHTIAFKKGETVNVPRICYKDAIACGAERADGSDVSDAFEEPKVKEAITNPIDRAELIEKHYLDLVEENNPDNFTATGLPKVAVMKERTGMENVSTKEIGRVISDLNERLENES